MPDTKITALTALTAADPANDVLPIVDVSDTTMAASGTTKKISINNVLGCSGTATLASATISGDLTVRTNKLAVTSTSVGIGTASPTLAAGVGLEIENAGITTLRLQNTSGANAFELQVDSDANGVLYRGYNNSPHVFYVNNSTAMTLNANGLGVGVSPAVLLDVQSASAVIRATSSTGTNTSFAAFANTGGAVRVGAENSAGGGLFTGSSAYSAVLGTTGAYSAHIGTSGAVRMTVDSAGNVGIGVTPAGTGGCLQLKSGITFPATQVASSDANTLDDYEEGTWTPTITAGTGTPTTTTVNTAKYTKIGRLVTVEVDFSIVAIGTASGALNFTVPTGFNQSTDGNVGALREVGATASMGQIFYTAPTTVGMALYNNATVWVNGYRVRGTYIYTV